jgi:hypothetical protein
VHTKSHTGFQTLNVDAERQAMSEWVDEGQDPELERRILEYIQRKLDKGLLR